MLADKSVKGCLIVGGLTSRMVVEPAVVVLFQDVDIPARKVRAYTRDSPVRQLAREPQ